MMIFTGEFTDLNTYVNAERSNRFMGAKIKREETDRVMLECLSEDNANQKPVTRPCIIHFTWYTKNERKDPDNVSGAGHKWLLDGLVKSGILINDTRKYIRGFTDDFKVDASFPRVVVEIEEL